jgi:hypothetical protein
MIPVGYMARRVSARPAWLRAERVVDIYSVSNCISADFADYIPFWKHNGYWFFDSPQIIRELVREQAISLDGLTLFYYEAYELEFDGDRGEWRKFSPEASLPTNVLVPAQRILEGYDVVTFSAGTSPEDSPLSCNRLAEDVETNSHCLLNSIEEACELLERDAFAHAEPGPYRIFAVHSARWP